MADRSFALAMAGAVVLAAPSGAVPPIELADVAAGDGGFVINGIEAGDGSISTVALTADVNGDGLADVVVGRPYADAQRLYDSGASYVVFGKADGSAVDLAAVAGGTGGFVMNAVGEYNYCGYSVSGAGDVNGDGLADVVVGAFLAGPVNDGEVYVVFGKADGTPVELEDVVGGIGGFVVDGNGSDQIGWSVSGAGDVNGDGLSDIVIGAPYAPPPAGSVNSGEAYVVFGKRDGTPVCLADVIGGSGEGFQVTAIAASDFLGWSVAGAGDVNGDGLADVTIAGDFLIGTTYVVFGKADGAAVDLDSLEAGGHGFAIQEIADLDYAGWGISGAGDVNGDGLDDVIVGAPGADANGNDAGQSYVVLGKADSMPVDLADVAAGNGGFTINGIDPGDLSGRRVSGAGDVNGDGLDDVAVSAPRGDPGRRTDAGERYVVFSPYVVGDLDGDGAVGAADLLMLLAGWGPCPGACPPFCAGDLDGDCNVGTADLLELLARWG